MANRSRCSAGNRLQPDCRKAPGPSFLPDVDEITVQVNIFGDELPENTEAAQLTIEALTENIGNNTTPRFEILPEFPAFFIVIPDDDRKFLILLF